METLRKLAAGFRKTNCKVLLRRATPCLVGLLFVVSPGQVRGQTNKVKPPAGPSNRYLLVVETSRAMERRAEGLMQALGDLLAGGIGGQIHAGDTLGLWTFNEELYAGKLPLQQWTPQGRQTVMNRVLSFIRDQKFEKQSRLTMVMPQLGNLVKDSPYITIILFSTGEENIQGTPFDERINQLYKSWRDEQQKARMPLLTILRAKGGKLTDYAVSPPPWTVEMPPLPAELQKPATTATKSETIVPKSQPATPPTVAGKKTLPEKVETPKSEPAAVKTEPALPAPTPPKAELIQLAVPQPTANLVPAPSPPASPALSIAPSTLNPTKPPTSQPEPGTAAGKPTEAAAASSLVGKLESPGAQVSVQPEKAASAIAATNQEPARAAISAAPAPPAQTTTVAPPESLFRNHRLWLSAVIVLLTVIALTLLLKRRARPSTRLSLITRSLDRDEQI